MGYDRAKTTESILDRYLRSHGNERTYRSLSRFLLDESLSGLDLEWLFREADKRNISFRAVDHDRALRNVLGNPDVPSDESVGTAAGHYYQSISEHDLLSAEEEVQLFRSLEKGRKWQSQAVLSTVYAVREYNRELERILDQDLSVKNVLDISRTEKLSEGRERELLAEARKVGESVSKIEDELLRRRKETGSPSQDDVVRTLRNELITEFNRVDVDPSLVKDWAQDLEEISAGSAPEDISDATKTVLSFAQQHTNFYRNKIVTSNLKLVVSQVNNFLNQGLSYMDLIQEGNIGLLKAIRRFEYEKGYKFSTYATWWIRQKIQRAIHQKKGLIQIPVHRREEMGKLYSAREELRQEEKGEPGPDQLAEKLNWSVDKVERILSVKDRPLSLDSTPDDEEDGRSIQEEVSGSGVEDVESPLNKKSLQDQLQDLLSELDWRKRQLVRMRFGLDDENERTLKEIGELMDLSMERVRQIENETLAELSERAKETELSEFIHSV